MVESTTGYIHINSVADGTIKRWDTQYIDNPIKTSPFKCIGKYTYLGNLISEILHNLSKAKNTL
ncbi:hypothetical protein K502DRAFT_325867, partial [Neoconidiobolus thromboides FSU 785]